MSASSLRPVGRPLGRRGQAGKARLPREAALRQPVFPFPAASRFSSTFRLFASAATERTTPTAGYAAAPECRSRVKVWEATRDEGGPQAAVNSCARAVSAGCTAGGPTGPQATHREGEVQWSRQLLGHSIHAVVFAPAPQRLERRVCSMKGRQGDAVTGDDNDGSSECSEIDNDGALLLIGTDKGMVAAADVGDRCGGKLLYAVYLGDAHTEGESEATVTNHNNPYDVPGEHKESGAATTLAATAMGRKPRSIVHDLQTLPGRAAAVLALVGCLEGSIIYLLNVKDGTVLQENALSKSYTLMATPSRLILAGAHKDGRPSSASLHQVALLGCGSARRADKHTESDESPRTGVLFLFDVPQRKKWLKLSGAAGDCCCSLALHDKLDYAAACFHRTTHQQQAQLLVWRLPSRRCRLSEGGAAAGRKKLPPAASTHFFESFVQLLLPLMGCSSTEKRAPTGVNTLDQAAGAHADRRKPSQVLVGLSRSSVIAVWGCFGSVSGEATAATFSLELLLQVNTAHRVCLPPSAVFSKEFSTRPALAAAAQGPGVWYIEEDTSNRMLGEALQPSRRKIRTSEAEGEASAQELITLKQHEVVLRVVRGSYAVPLFALVILPAYSDCNGDPADQQAYLPLLVTTPDKSCGGALRPLPAKAITQSVREDMNEEHFTTDGICQADGVIAGAELGPPTVSWKRKIGAASSSEAHGNTAVSTLDDGQIGGLKARGLALNEQVGGPGAERSSVASVLRQALVSSDARLLESVLCSTAKDKKEVAAAVASLAPARALVLLQHLVQQQRNSPATSILKGPWIEELVKQHGVVLGTTEAGREQLVLLLLQVEERRRAEAALVKVKGRVELLLQQMQRIKKLKEQRLREEVEAREPLVVHREHARS